MKVQLITFTGCQNADGARELLRRCLSRAGLEPVFEEIDSLAPGTPGPLREWGSPTILLDGVDVQGETRPTGPGCRLYRDASGYSSGAPSESLLLEAIERAKRASGEGAI